MKLLRPPVRLFSWIVAAGCVVALGGAPAAAQNNAAVQLESVQSQQLANGHTRILLQFNGNVVIRPNDRGVTSSYVLQIPNANLAPSVAGIIPVNQGSVQTVTVGQFGTVLNIQVATSVPVHPTLVAGPSRGLYMIDFPAAPAPNASVNPFAQQQAPVANPAAQQTRIIRLRYADVSEAVGILTNNGAIAPTSSFNPQPSQLGSSGVSGIGGTELNQLNQPGIGQQFQQFNQFPQQQFGQQYGEQGQALGQRISDTLAVDRRLNAVIVTGTPEQIAQAESLIRMIDVPVESVLLDTQVLEVTETGAKALGLDYNQSTTTPLTRLYNTQAQILNSAAGTVGSNAIALQTNLFLLVSKGQARVLAAPKILTQNGVPASILTGDSLPIRVTTPVGVGGVGTVSSQVEYINVGVNLQILPRVTGDGGVDTNVFSQVSSVTGFTSSNDPQISTRQAQTKVNVVEGQTLVIGGLLQQRDIRNLQKIPVLGDLPLIGALFRFYTETRQDTNLIITITPHVVAAPIPRSVTP
ncbi:MAG: type II secretion system protein GspD [Candidatus Eremiobacteraeota bacterium]|nr:type II secretion system protein GspD [Candidatus Eremiobacteraeota bacterium]MBC5827829.1 type II secretion system protein GspD [Candidatus Eremiobacteraeota bacterium]